MEIQTLVQMQRDFFHTDDTKNIKNRIRVLQSLRRWIMRHQDLICEALKRDLNKDAAESYMCEIGLVLSEIDYQIRHIEIWSKAKKVRTPLAQFYGESYETYEPYGVTLVMSPWNYPFMLSVEPAVGAIAAGNTVIIKPSAYAPSVSRVIKKMVEDTCNKRYVAVVEGGRKENAELLEQRFDYIFFTGSVNVGKIVMEKASRYLTPVTLELGGKSPCIVDDARSLKLAAKRIAFGKFLNAGQTCVAPDYLLIRENLKDRFLFYLRNVIREFFGENPVQNEQLVKIINEKHFRRLSELLEDQAVVIGGECDPQTLKIAPTVVDHVNGKNPLMQEEIFGPILPVLTYRNVDDAIRFIRGREKPLALYLFSQRKEVQKKFLKSVSFGGGCINDTIIHLATSELGFGGVGNSGMGSYHGKKSFQTFSHTRSIVKKAVWIDLPFRYYPYTKTKEKMIRMFEK